ncbi:hypothetical protein Aperf_G00000046904 [Anoplocephala perfoliata]
MPSNVRYLLTVHYMLARDRLHQMLRQGVTDSVSLQDSFDNDFVNEFNAFENTLNAELNYVPLQPSSFLQASKSDIPNDGMIVDQQIPTDSANEQSESDSIESVRPPNAHSLPIEDPIETYDSIVDEMKSKGVQWVPPEQMGKSLSEVRLATPEGQLPHIGTNSLSMAFTVKDQDVAPSGTQATVSPLLSQRTIAAPTKTSPESATPSTNGHRPSSGMSSFQRFTSNCSDQSTSESVLKLKELQNQLNQEKATRKQQEDYIQQLQHYYDNLLAKHAAAEMTIDHFRFRAQVDPKDSSPTKNPPLAKTPVSNSLRGRKLISASLDTCSPDPLLSKTNHSQPHIAGSLTALREDSPISTVKRRTSLRPPQVHLVSLSSAPHDPSESDRPLESSSKSCAGEDGVFHSSGSSSNGSKGGLSTGNSRQQPNADVATQDAARSLEGQLNDSLAAIHDRLNAIEACLLNDRRNDSLDAIRCELEDLRRKYQAGLYLWSDAGGFDSKTVVGSQLNHLTQRLERVASREKKDTPTPARPSSLSFMDSHRTGSTESNHTSSAHTTSGSQTSGHHESSSSPTPALLNITVGAAPGRGDSSTPPSVDNSLESTEAFFARLLARYNKLKIIPGRGKDVESLMQRMLQLSERYSAQSTVIFPPKSLRRMFESDYNINNGANEPLIADHQACAQPLSSKMINDVSAKSRQMVSPDSGVPHTPLGSSGSSGNSCYGNTLPSRINPTISSSTRPKSAAADSLAVDQHRKQSDSGFWAADSYSAAPAPPFKDTTLPSASSFANTDETEIDLNTSHPSKMLPDEVMSLEADIQRLRRGIARLTSSTSVSSGPQYRDSRMKSDSSTSTCAEQPRKSSRRQALGGRKSNNLDPISSSKRSSATRRQPRLPNSTSSSDDEAPYGRSRYPQSSRSRNRQFIDSGPPLEVIGSSITPQPRSFLPCAGQTRIYRRNSSASRGQEDLSVGSDVVHRRSHSTIGRTRSYYHPCGSCGGSGFNINSVGREREEECVFEAPLHSHTVSDTYTMPSRVIYEFGQTPTVRLPVHNEYSGWTERIYGMKEIYGSSVSPQMGRAYNTIGHQPPIKTRSWLNSNQVWDSIGPQPILVPTTSSSATPQRVSRRTRQYVPSVGSDSIFHGDRFSSDSEDRSPRRNVTVLPTSRSFCNHRRSRHRRQSSRRTMLTETEGPSSSANGNIDAFSAARSVTQMAHNLNSKLSHHQEFREYLPQQQQFASSYVRQSSRLRNRSDGSQLDDF